MGFLIVGIVLLVLKLADVSFVAGWHWGWILAPFGLAAVWWAFIDSSGITQRREMKKMEDRKLARRERDMNALGLSTKRDGRRGIKVMRDKPRDGDDKG